MGIPLKRTEVVTFRAADEEVAILKRLARFRNVSTGDVLRKFLAEEWKKIGARVERFERVIAEERAKP